MRLPVHAACWVSYVRRVYEVQETLMIEDDTADSWVRPKSNKRGRPPKRREQQDQSEIGDRVRHLRINILKMPTQAEFATKLGVSRGAVGNWELGKGIKRENIERISRAYGVSVDWLNRGAGRPRDDFTVTIQEKIGLLPPDEYERFHAEHDAIINALLDSRLAWLRERKAVARKKG